MTTSNQSESTTKSSEKLPPGMVIGPDGKPCKICTAFRYWKPTKATDNKSKTSPKTSQNASFVSVTATMNALANGSSSSPQNTGLDGPPEGCPPDVEQLGRATWTFLHTTAAYYPDKPSASQRTRMLGLLFALPVLYPCSWCAMDFGEHMKVNPPDVSSRTALSRWLCERHNEVNQKLGKPTFDCSLKSTDERWKDGPADGRCE